MLGDRNMKTIHEAEVAIYHCIDHETEKAVLLSIRQVINGMEVEYLKRRSSTQNVSEIFFRFQTKSGKNMTVSLLRGLGTGTSGIKKILRLNILSRL
jgi:hypothetical protein